MLTVHHLNNSRSQRVLWLLEELGLPYEIKHYQRDAKTMLAPPELKAIHPLGKSPVVTEGAIVLAETGAIVETVIERYADGRAMPPLLMKLVFEVLPQRAPFLVKGLVGGIARTAQSSFIDPQLKAHFDYWEAELGKSEWFAGTDFSAADIMMSFPLEAGASRGGALEGRPRLTAFLHRIHNRPAYRTALEKGGPYAYAY